MKLESRSPMVRSASTGVKPWTSTSLISGTVILPSARTIAAGTEASGSFQTRTCSTSPEPIRYPSGTPWSLKFLSLEVAAATAGEEDLALAGSGGSCLEACCTLSDAAACIANPSHKAADKKVACLIAFRNIFDCSRTSIVHVRDQWNERKAAATGRLDRRVWRRPQNSTPTLKNRRIISEFFAYVIPNLPPAPNPRCGNP